MATRMQQRKGTAAQWTAAAPILNAGEIGWESDTNKFKIGDGTNHWADLDYFADINSTANPAFGSSITFEGATANDFETVLQITDPTADRTITFPNATGTVALAADVAALSGANFTGAITGTSITLSGDLTINGNNTILDTATVKVQNSIVFEGATANDFETTIQVTEPTQDNVITLQNAGGVIPLRDTTDTFSNKSISLSTNTITGTKAEFNTAMSDADFATLAGTETLTNKTLTSPTVSGLTLSDGLFVIEGATADDHELTISAGNPTGDRTVTFQDVTGTVALTADITNMVTLDGTQTLTNKTLTSPTINTPSGITKTDVGLASVDNTTDANKPVSTATQTALDLKAALASPTFTGTVSGISSSMVGLGSVDNTTDASKPVSTATQTALNLKADLAGATFTGAVSGTSLTLSGDLTVNGTTTNLNSTSLVIEDKNIVLGDTTEPTDITADGGGITLKGTTDHTFNWVDASDAWTSSEHINIASGKSYYVNNTLLKDVTETLTNKTLTSAKINLGINAQTGTSYTFVVGDDGKFVTADNAAAIIVTVPPTSSEAYPIGAQLNIVQKGAGQVTFAQGSGVTIRSTGTTATAPKLRVQYSSATCVHEGNDVWYVVGDIS